MSGLPVIPFFSDKQSGETFGEKLCNAIEQGFKQGYNKLLICGTDCPELTSSKFNDAAIQLSTNQMLVSPSADGGVNLIGLQSEAFHRAKFLNLPWLTSNVYAQLNAYAADLQLSLSIQPVTTDVDDVTGMFQFTAAHQDDWLSKLLLQLLVKPHLVKTTFSSLLFSSTNGQAWLLRGPPGHPSLQP